MVAEKPKKPKKTGEEVAAEVRQRVALDRETDEEERRLRAMARGRLGASSLLAGMRGAQRGGSKTTSGSSTAGSGGSYGGGVGTGRASGTSGAKTMQVK